MILTVDLVKANNDNKTAKFCTKEVVKILLAKYVKKYIPVNAPQMLFMAKESLDAAAEQGSDSYVNAWFSALLPERSKTLRNLSCAACDPSLENAGRPGFLRDAKKAAKEAERLKEASAKVLAQERLRIR
jgi:hypothetical protein